MSDLSSFAFFLSGGATNTEVANSRGGVISASRITSINPVVLSTLTGVTAIDAFNSGEADYVLSYDASDKTLSILNSTKVVIDRDGTFYLPTQAGNVNSGIIVSVTQANLPTTNTVDSFTLTFSENNIFEAVTVAEIANEETEYSCFYAKNTSSTSSWFNLFFWLLPTGNNDVSLEIGFEPGDINVTAQTIPTQYTEPTGVTFFDVKDIADAVGNIDFAPGDIKGIWIKRTTKNTLGSNLRIDYGIGFRGTFGG